MCEGALALPPHAGGNFLPAASRTNTPPLGPTKTARPFVSFCNVFLSAADICTIVFALYVDNVFFSPSAMRVIHIDKQSHLIINKYITLKMDTHSCNDLLEAASGGHESCVRELLAAGVNPNVGDDYGNTPLHRAAYNGHEACVRVLIAAGADPNVGDDYGNTPLLEATWNGHEACVAFLIAAGADPNVVVGDYGNTPLYQAAWDGHEACVRVLIAAGADPNVIDYYGSTPLHRAASEGHESCVRELLASGADPNVADKTGETPLQCAVRQERTGCVKILIIRILTDRSLTDAEWDLITTVMNIGPLLPIVLALYGRDAAAKLVSRLPEDKRKVLETVAMCLSRFVSRDLIEPILVRCA